MHSTSTLEIDLGAVDHNVRVLRDIIGPDCPLCAVVKADAYGLGAARVGRQLAQAGADMLAVYTPEQAVELARASIALPILVLMPVRDITRAEELAALAIAGRLHLAVHDEAHLEEVLAIAGRFGVTLPIHLEVDTGMSRGGCSTHEAPRVLRRIASSPDVRLAGVFTHFAHAEVDGCFTDQQAAAFDQLVAEQHALIPASCLIHAANTFATLRSGRYHRAMVRVGLAWAGYGPEWMRGEVNPAAGRLRPALRWTTAIVQIRALLPGATVGYGRTWTARHATTIGLVPVGYADGYPIGAGATDSGLGGASVLLVHDGNVIGHAPVVGAVNMDQIAVNLSSVGEAVNIGTMVELVSPDGSATNHLPRLAAAAGTIPHELMCRLGPRVRRVYVTAARPVPLHVLASAAG